jgi:hypothetical protein
VSVEASAQVSLSPRCGDSFTEMRCPCTVPITHGCASAELRADGLAHDLGI